jgi:serine phosphatase RsbU (regulator of sigma subunit)
VTQQVRETTIDSTLLPVDWARFDGVDIYAEHHSECRGGDFFDALILGDRVLFLLTDIAGPRPEALRVEAAVQSTFRDKAEELFGPTRVDEAEVNESDAMAALAHAVNLSLIEAATGAQFAPTFMGCFQRRLGILTYCNAGNVLALARDGDEVRTLESSGMPLGLFTHTTFEAMFLALQRGEALLLVTKGVTESKRGRAEFGVEAVTRLLGKSTAKSASGLCDEVLREVYDFGNSPWARLLSFLHAGDLSRRDDLTALALVRQS